MSRKSAPSLASNLIARKGEAAPVSSPALVDSIPREEGATPSLDVAQEQKSVTVTVRLQPDLYQRLKIFGATKRKTNQDLLVAAIESYISANQ